MFLDLGTGYKQVHFVCPVIYLLSCVSTESDST